MDDLLSVIETIYKQLDPPEVIKKLINVQNVQEFKEVRKLLYDEANLEILLRRDLEYYDSFLNVVNVVEVSNENKNYSLLDKYEYQLSKKLAQRIQAKKVIHKKYRLNALKKYREKSIKSPLIYWTLSEFVKPESSRAILNNVRLLGQNLSMIYEIPRSFEKLKRLIINTFYQTYLDNPLDFHYIVAQIQINNQQLEEYKQKIINFLNEMDMKKKDELVQYFIKVKKEIELRAESFETWSKTNVKLEVDTKAMLQRNKKVLQLKWTIKSNKVQKIAQKRAGLKKQKYLELKKDMLKKK